jgi:hypothetical protein
MEFEPVKPWIFLRGNGIIGTDHGTHGASDAGIFHPGFLADTVKGFILVGMLFIFFNRCFNDSFLEYGKLNCLDRADGRTLAAQGAPVIIIPDLPWQVIQA